MAIYDSKCQKCEHEVTEIRTMSQGINPDCPECGGKDTMEKTWNKAPVFYCTGYMVGHPRAQRGRKIKEPWRK